MFNLTVTDRDGEQTTLEAEEGQSVMTILRDAGLPIEAVCGGCCSCATCHVFVADDWIAKCAPRSQQETDLLDSLEHFDATRSRLSCQITFTARLDGLAVRLAPEE